MYIELRHALGSLIKLRLRMPSISVRKDSLIVFRSKLRPEGLRPPFLHINPDGDQDHHNKSNGENNHHRIQVCGHFASSSIASSLKRTDSRCDTCISSTKSLSA